MFRDVLAPALSLLVTVGCTPIADKASRSLVVSVPSEPLLAGDAIIHGHRTAELSPTPPDANSLAQAMHECGRNRFQIIGGDTHWEAVTVTSNEGDNSLLHCIKGRVSFDFTADYTNDRVITSASKFERVKGI